MKRLFALLGILNSFVSAQVWDVDTELSRLESQLGSFINQLEPILAEPIRYIQGSAGTCKGRLTLESGVPLSTTDQTAKTTLYFTPFLGGKFAVYDGSKWLSKNFSEISLALGTLSNNTNYDAFVYSNAGTLTLELLAWTDNTTRATDITLQDGVYVQNGAATRRYVGTLRTTSTTTTEDSLLKRFVWSHCHRRMRPLQVTESTNSWTYTSTTIRSTNNSSANRVEYVSGLGDSFIKMKALLLRNSGSFSSGYARTGVGVDSTSADSAQLRGAGSTDYNTDGNIGQMWATYQGYPGLGYHYLQWVESSHATITFTFYGDNNTTVLQSGMTGFVEG